MGKPKPKPKAKRSVPNKLPGEALVEEKELKAKGKSVVTEEKLAEKEPEIYQVETDTKRFKFTLPITFIAPNQGGKYSPQITEERRFFEGAETKKMPGLSVIFHDQHLIVSDFEIAKAIIQSRFFEETIYIQKTGPQVEISKVSYTEGAQTTSSMRVKKA